MSRRGVMEPESIPTNDTTNDAMEPLTLEDFIENVNSFPSLWALVLEAEDEGFLHQKWITEQGNVVHATFQEGKLFDVVSE